ncbi:hypothetical protein NEIMUCOT_06591 [Neisseria mucosa ATCC 25996]|uniref:Uncharacterized protein n=1 Tax=Neisseria mucosa (strain ATCC 25996 / DSM 4631 / NCTC 10774 / M26) TaxID=546266 RepID=D3A100_NEIM2|nr:hypothetical protein NEIMUCOT_06591 [Neisseria mucosa ATCC 25996]
MSWWEFKGFLGGFCKGLNLSVFRQSKRSSENLIYGFQTTFVYFKDSSNQPAICFA